ncbi:hypothetical protein [Streptomyces sp. NBC_01255]|uniref:hypothetical protein n=1 Tax=Streptomyces sp. NBC_01255 TaxID=2903798 RepID=UPI002E368D96|nr:hypothetical protein [Streptomyces sp. NBC_01255]
MERPTRRTLAVAAAAAALATLMPTVSAAIGPTATEAGSAPEASPRPTVVLVHGGFDDSSNWNGVIARLQKDGGPVAAPANPLRGLPTD